LCYTEGTTILQRKGADPMETLLTLPQQGMDQLTGWLAANPQLCG